MVWCTLMVINFKLLSHRPNCIVDKVSPWSLIKILGHPNLVITYSNRKCVVVSTLQSLTSAAFSHLVKYFVTVMIYLDPNIIFGGLIGPQILFPIFQITAKLLVVLGASHPFCCVFQPSDRHHISDNIP
jgi:hypothetical protein